MHRFNCTWVQVRPVHCRNRESVAGTPMARLSMTVVSRSSKSVLHDSRLYKLWGLLSYISEDRLVSEGDLTYINSRTWETPCSPTFQGKGFAVDSDDHPRYPVISGDLFTPVHPCI